MPRSPRELVSLYIEQVWNEGDMSAVRDFCADPYHRHDSGRLTTMSHDEQVDRVTEGRAIATAPDGTSLHFDSIILTGDDEYVTWAFNMTAPLETALAAMDFPMEKTSTTVEMSGIEVFRVVDGRIAEVWNAPVGGGLWG